MKPGLGPLIAVVLGAAGCGRTAPIGGLVVTMSTDLTLENVAPTRLDVAVRSLAAGGKTYLDATYAVPGDTSLPARMVIQSNGDPAASVEIDVSLWQETTPLDARQYRVESIPTDHFDPVGIVFSAKCTPLVRIVGTSAVSLCPEGETCDPSTGTCTSNIFGAADDASASPAEPGDAQIETSVIEGSQPDAGSVDAGTIDASPLDATDDVVVTPADASPGCDAGDPACSPAALECAPACLPGVTYCFKGACAPVPASCLGNDTPACASDEVPGGTFDRSYDGVTYTDAGFPATITGFRLDADEVNVARFANFVTAVLLGNGLPEAGAGKHVHLNGGLGLVDVTATDGGTTYESGWNPAWNANIPSQQSDWDTEIGGFVSSTWIPPNLSLNANLPINGVTWYEAYAFCIWDGGFLPTEAEWNYAASGGSDQRVYPWGSADPGTASEYAIYDCYYMGTGFDSCSSTQNIAPVGSAPNGNGKFGQANLAGSMFEWTLDAYAPYVNPCTDCVAGEGTNRVYRGGSYNQMAEYLDASSRQSSDPAKGYGVVGFRCARTP
jgi:sulfatase modifying factor 1